MVFGIPAKGGYLAGLMRNLPYRPSAPPFHRPGAPGCARRQPATRRGMRSDRPPDAARSLFKPNRAIASGRTPAHHSWVNWAHPKVVMVSFGPPYAPLDLRQVEAALQEVRTLRDAPDMIVFAAMQFDPEAAKFIDDSRWPGVDILKAQMSADMLVGNLRRGDPHAESFMLLGQPDARLEDAGDGKYRVRVIGFDYYDAKNGRIESGGPSRIAMWMLDTDYDGRSLYPQQVFFPMAAGGGGRDDGWGNLARALRGHVDSDAIARYAGTDSIEFEPGDHNRVAVKIIDDRGIELVRVLEVPH